MARMMFFKTGEKFTVVNLNDVWEMNRLIGAEFGESVTLFDVEKGSRICAWVDDSGMINKREKNYMFYGDFLIGKVNSDGYNIDITDEEIKLVNESFESWIAKKMNKHENEIIDKFLDDIKEYLDPTPMTFNFEKSPWAQIITVSYFEVIDNLRCSKRKDINDMLMDMALRFRGASKTKKKQIVEIIKDVFKDFAKQIAEFKSEDFAQQFGVKAE